MADKKVSPGCCSVIKALNQSFLRRLVEIDHDITAEDNIKIQFKLYWFHQIKAPEDYI